MSINTDFEWNEYVAKSLLSLVSMNLIILFNYKNKKLSYHKAYKKLYTLNN